MNVDFIVKNDYCIGCGVCAGICPSNNLYMDWSNRGELVPHSKNSCKENCSFCLEICPFFDHNVNQDTIAENLFSKIPGINYNTNTGYYTECYVGYKKNEKDRLKCASGGAATSFLSSLLIENIVNRIIAVGISNDPDRIFTYKILKSCEEVNLCAGSAYYPVEISEIIKIILDEKSEDKYAAIALPCVVYSLRLAMEKIPKLKRKIILVASLTCGQLQNRFNAELMALESGIPVETLAKLEFRRKAKGMPSSNFLQIAIDSEGREGIPFPNQELPFHLWHFQYFKHNACNFCDDIFGEVADVTFMDAWLPEYVKDYRGNSITIARIPLVKTLLENSKDLYLCYLNVDKVIKSQRGVIHKKRVLLRGRLYKKYRSNSWYPKKRVEHDVNIYKKNKIFIDLTEEIQDSSKKLWPKHRLDKSTKDFWKEMNNLEKKINIYKLLSRLKCLLDIPVKLIKKGLEVRK